MSVDVTNASRPADDRAGAQVADAALGLGIALARAGLGAARWAGWAVRPAAPLVRRAVHDPLVRRLVAAGAESRAAVAVALAERFRELLPRVLDDVLDQVDLTTVVLDRVDLDAVAAGLDLDAAAARIDVDAILARVDLIALAEYIIDGVDLPEIIRDSTGSMASEGIRSVRLQSIDADERVNRLVDRMLLRRHGRRTVALPEQATSPNGHEQS